MKLRTKIFLTFSIMATIPLLVLTLFSYRRYEQTIYTRMDSVSSHLLENAQNTANDMLNRLTQTAGAFNFYYDDGSSIIEDLKEFSNPDYKPPIYDYYRMSRSFDRTCQNLLYSDEYIYGIYIYTPSGYILESSTTENGSAVALHNYLNADWYKQTLKLDGTMYVSSNKVHFMFDGGKPSIFFAQCLKDIYSHKTVGVLVIDCKADMLDLSSVNTQPDTTLLTIDNKETSNILYTNYNKKIHTFSRKEATTFQKDLDIFPLRLTMTVDYDGLFREFNVTGMVLILMSFICIAGFIIIAYITSRYMVKPIEHISQKMAAQKGHSLIQVNRYLNRTDEIGTLYNEYNSMVESLNAAVKQDYQDKLIILDAQMKSLEARINSHFLFNTLEAINSMAELDDNEDIATMSLALGNMFRYTLKTQSELVTINDELNHVKDYVSIQSIRFDNRFRLVTDIPEELKNYKVLKLILQPLVENSLYHGLNYCTSGDTITIKGRTDGNLILIDVHDNGQGMSEETIESLTRTLSEEASFSELGHRTKQSIGLKNIHSRIELYYGQGYGLTITSQLGEWSNIQIRLPVLEKEGK